MIFSRYPNLLPHQAWSGQKPKKKCMSRLSPRVAPQGLSVSVPSGGDLPEGETKCWNLMATLAQGLKTS